MVSPELTGGREAEAPGGYVRSFSPQAPDELVGSFRAQTSDEIAGAVESARTAQRTWCALDAGRRSLGLTAAAAELRARRHEAVALVVREVGKPLGEAGGEVDRAISILDYYAQAAFAAVGAVFPPSLPGLLYSERRPHGVAGLITPWNFPMAIPLWKAAPALAAGNAVVLKPSPEAASCAGFLAEILSPRLPEGLFTVTIGGPEAGEAVVANADVVSFTGSAAVGRRVAVAAAARGVPVQCEMGGQNAAIVLADADVPTTAAMVARAAMGYAGQKCTATRRVIVVGDNDAFVEQLASEVSGLRPSDPAEATTVVGPVINELAYDAVLRAIELAGRDGGRVVAGGSPVGRAGWFVQPTLIDGLSPDHHLAEVETFGPLTLVLHAADLPAAIEVANSVRFGLVTSVHGRDLGQLLEAVKSIDTGLIKVNAPTTGVDFYAPFGGEKSSSYGPREQGMAALEFYGSTRTVTVAPPGG
jgi:acyl-CoA reductase-like NAD-dependent aldehyde dehydrogenase